MKNIIKKMSLIAMLSSSLFASSHIENLEKIYEAKILKENISHLNYILKTDYKEDIKRVRVVNVFFNLKVRYVDDYKAYGKREYIPSLNNFLGRGGDCEDFAIYKKLTLEQMGVKNVKIVIVKLKDNQLHAVNFVKIKNTTVVLDNRYSYVTELKNRKDFKIMKILSEKEVIKAIKSKNIQSVYKI